MKKEVTPIDQTVNIKQSNKLIESRYRLTTYEQRMVIAICSQLKNSNDKSPVIRLNVSDLADFCKFEPQKKYSLVKTTARRLRSRTLEYQKPDGKWYITGWVNSAEYLDDGTIEFCIDPKLTPQLLQLKSAYLSTPAAPLMEFKCDYTARFYFMLKKMLKIHSFDYELDFLRDRLQLSKSYCQISNLKSRVIEPAIKEINEASDIRVTHEYIKEGRTYTKIHFTVEKEKATSEEELLEQATGQQRLIEHTSDSVQEVADRLIKRGVSSRMAKTYAKKYDTDRINRNLALAVKQKDTAKNLPGLIIEFIKNDTAGQAVIAKAEVKKREKKREADARQAYELFHGKAQSEPNGDYAPPVIISKNGKVVSK
ncbi:MAG: replication initiation protein [Aeriscardovia sp.]|nr:replication initiation protein [Aeriscardovia sp.]